MGKIITVVKSLGLSLLIGATVNFMSTTSWALEIEEITTPKGINFWLAQETEVPLITMSFSFEGGSILDPSGQEGLSRLLSATLDEGAGDLDSQSFQGKLQELSIELRFRASRERFSGTFQTLSENRELAFELLKLAITVPRFDEEPVARMKAALSVQLRQELSRPESVASQAWFENAYVGHPYSRSPHGALETLEKLTPENLQELKTRLIAKDGLKLTIVGDLDIENAIRLVDDVFGDLPERKQPVSLAPPQQISAERVFVNHPAEQTIFRIGGAGILQDDSDFFAGFVVNHILGGGSFTSRLYRQVREERGLAYTVSSYLSSFEKSGFFIVATGTRGGQAHETQDLILAAIKDMAENGPTKSELRAAKDYLKGAFALRFDASDKIADQLLYYQERNLGIDYIHKRNAFIEAVSLADAKRVAKRIYDTPVLIVAVGAVDPNAKPDDAPSQ